MQWKFTLTLSEVRWCIEQKYGLISEEKEKYLTLDFTSVLLFYITYQKVKVILWIAECPQCQQYLKAHGTLLHCEDDCNCYSSNLFSISHDYYLLKEEAVSGSKGKFIEGIGSKGRNWQRKESIVEAEQHREVGLICPCSSSRHFVVLTCTQTRRRVLERG